MNCSKYVEHVTANGLNVHIETLDGARSTGVGFFVATGSRDEDPQFAGVSHFLEHMAFKSTKKRSAQEVCETLDRMGSKANAYTSWERTAYYARILPENTREAISLLAEMIDPALLEEDFDMEKKVILEEIEMYNDRPEFLLFEGMMERRFSGHPLEKRILGTKQTVSDLSYQDMKKYHTSRYCNSNILLAVSGAVKPDEIISWAEEINIGTGSAERDHIEKAPFADHIEFHRPEDQIVHYAAFWPGPINTEIKKRVIAGVLDILLGDDEGSRLSWTMLHTGLVLDIEIGAFSFFDSGIFYSGFSCIPENHEQAKEIMLSEIQKLKSENFQDGELERAKIKFATRTILSSESTMGRLSGTANDWLDNLPHLELQEELDMIMDVTRDDLEESLSLFDKPVLSGAIGPLEKE